MSYATPRVVVPASALTLLAERHEVVCTAYRRGQTPEVNLPSIYRIARDVVHGRGALDLYRERG